MHYKMYTNSCQQNQTKLQENKNISNHKYSETQPDTEDGAFRRNIQQNARY